MDGSMLLQERRQTLASNFSITVALVPVGRVEVQTFAKYVDLFKR